jgi:formate dehydrogenase subunit gamma
MPRFSALEMIVHWTTAISFCLLGISGLIMLFGKHVLLPVIGYTLFGWLTQLSKNLHNFIAPIFIVAVIVMILLWARDNLPKAYDWQWFRNAWAFFAHSKHIPSGRFNAGEKVWFWGGVLVLSTIVAWSGLILLFPNFDQTRATMQDAWAVHATAALIYIVISFGHIYMGTIGVEHTYGNMRHGYTDETWAKEHHEIWYNEVKSGQRAPTRGGRAVPASIVLVLGAGLLVGAVAASYAKLPPPPAKTDAEKTAEAEKAASQKAKEAADLAKAQDKAVANYKKNNAGKKDVAPKK